MDSVNLYVYISVNRGSHWLHRDGEKKTRHPFIPSGAGLLDPQALFLQYLMVDPKGRGKTQQKMKGEFS